MSKFIGFVVAGIEIAAGIAIAFLPIPGAILIANYLITAGAGTLLASGVSTISGLISGPGAGQQSGFTSASRNPIAAWNGIYGTTATGGAAVFIQHP